MIVWYLKGFCSRLGVGCRWLEQDANLIWNPHVNTHIRRSVFDYAMWAWKFNKGTDVSNCAVLQDGNGYNTIKI